MSPLVLDVVVSAVTGTVCGGGAALLMLRHRQPATKAAVPLPFDEDDLVDDDPRMVDAVERWATKNGVPEATPLLLGKMRLGRQLQRRNRR